MQVEQDNVLGGNITAIKNMASVYRYVQASRIIKLEDGKLVAILTSGATDSELSSIEGNFKSILEDGNNFISLVAEKNKSEEENGIGFDIILLKQNDEGAHSFYGKHKFDIEIIGRASNPKVVQIARNGCYRNEVHADFTLLKEEYADIIDSLLLTPFDSEGNCHSSLDCRFKAILQP